MIASFGIQFNFASVIGYDLWAVYDNFIVKKGRECFFDFETASQKRVQM